MEEYLIKNHVSVATKYLTTVRAQLEKTRAAGLENVECISDLAQVTTASGKKLSRSQNPRNQLI